MVGSSSPDGSIRAVSFFPSGSELLYGSLYGASKARSGIVICPPWGWESIWMNDSLHSLARDAADSGGAALVFHWPGHGDSEGEPEDATLDRLVEAARDAAQYAARHMPSPSWYFAGIRLGAVAAARAAVSSGIDRLLLVQPALDPADWLRETDRLASAAEPGWVGGFPVSPRVRHAATEALPEDLRAFGGRVAAACYESLTRLPLPESAVVRTVPGDWRRRIRSDHRAVFDAAGPLIRSLADG